MHINPTLDVFSQVTTSVGKSLHAFKEKTSVVFPTWEFECEWVARTQRQAKGMAATVPGSSKSRPTKSDGSVREPKQLNLRTYKLHAVGDYLHTIQRVGTTESDRLILHSARKFPLTPCTILLNIKPCTTGRVNVSTEHQKHGSFGLVADQYHSSCRGLNDNSIVSTSSARSGLPLKSSWRILPMILECGTI
jgi:hypothetical protein